MPVVRIGAGLRTSKQRKEDIEFWKKVGKYVTGQAEGTVPYSVRRAVGLPERLRTGEQKDFSLQEGLDFAGLAMGPPRGGGIAGMGPRKVIPFRPRPKPEPKVKPGDTVSVKMSFKGASGREWKTTVPMPHSDEFFRVTGRTRADQPYSRARQLKEGKVLRAHIENTYGKEALGDFNRAITDMEIYRPETGWHWNHRLAFSNILRKYSNIRTKLTEAEVQKYLEKIKFEKLHSSMEKAKPIEFKPKKED